MICFKSLIPFNSCTNHKQFYILSINCFFHSFIYSLDSIYYLYYSIYAYVDGQECVTLEEGEWLNKTKTRNPINRACL